VKGFNRADNFSGPVTAPDHTVEVGILMNWIEERNAREFWWGQPGFGPRHPHEQKIHDSQDDLPRSRPWLKREN
jgi:hypothetical protein